jgi:hypothetical protein
VTIEATERRCERLPAEVRAGAPCPRALDRTCRYGCRDGACALVVADENPDGMTLGEVAKHFRCTRENVRQIEAQALARPGIRRLLVALGAEP